MFNKIVKPKMKENENREQAILRAAEREFTTRGFDGAKTTSIAEAAGVTHALLHYYFRTKEKLYERVLDDIVSRLEASIVEAFAASGAPFTSRLEEGLRRHFLFLLDHPDLPRFLIHEIGARSERIALVRARMGRLVGRVFASLQADMERQAARGEIARVSLADLLLDAVSLNAFVFLSYPVIAQLLAPGVEPRAFFLARLEENLTVIRKRLIPDPPCETASPSCSSLWLP